MSLTSLPSPESSPPPVKSLAFDLHALAASAPTRAWTLGELMDTLGGRASALLVLVCALPFCSPITIPGLSTPFGLVIFLLSLRFALGLPPWLPNRLRRVTLPPKTLGKILEAGSKVIGWFERRMKTRWSFLVDPLWKTRVHAIMVILASMLLMLPLPPVPPFTNTLPALVIVILTLSSLQKDGVGIVAGYTVFVGTVIYFAFWAAVIVETCQRLAQKFGLGV